MKMFVIAAGVFAVLMYLVYGYNYPIDGDVYNEGGSLFSLYSTIMIFQGISGVLVLCQIMSGARRIEIQSPEHGQACKM